MADWAKSLLAFSIMLLAGCTGSTDDGSNNQVDPLQAPTNVAGEERSDAGNIRGSVVNEEDAPVEGARVGLLGTGLGLNYTATTDASGAFAFLGVPPGTYTLIAQRLGYREFIDDTLRIETGTTTETIVKLYPLPSEEQWVDILEFNGLISGVSTNDPVFGELEYPLTCGSDCTMNSFSWKLNDRADALQGVVGELKWQNTQTLGGNLILYVNVLQQSTNPDKTFMKVEDGPDYLIGVADADKTRSVVNQNDAKCPADADPIMDKHCKLELFVYTGRGNTGADVDASVGLFQRFSAAISQFYRMDAPEDYAYLAEV